MNSAGHGRSWKPTVHSRSAWHSAFMPQPILQPPDLLKFIPVVKPPSPITYWEEGDLKKKKRPSRLQRGNLISLR